MGEWLQPLGPLGRLCKLSGMVPRSGLHRGTWRAAPGWGGEPAGLRQATITFSETKTFHRVVIWQHGNGQIAWQALTFVRTLDREFPSLGAGAISDVLEFGPVRASKVRYSFDNQGDDIDGNPIIHGWIYEIEVFANVIPPHLRPEIVANKFELAWESEDPGIWQLETTMALASDSIWVSVAAAVSVAANQERVTLPTDVASQFYRLRLVLH